MENDEIKDVANNEQEEKVELTENVQENNDEVLSKDVNETKEEIIAEVKEETVDEGPNELEELMANETHKPIKFWKSILGSALDQLVVLPLSGIILIVFDFLIEFIGYKVVMPIPVLLIIYGIVNCIYAPIISSTKLNKTLGQKVFNI